MKKRILLKSLLDQHLRPSWIDNILKQHSDIENYREAIQHVLDEKKIVLFSIPSDEAEPGAEYSPPEWNADQKNSIISIDFFRNSKHLHIFICKFQKKNI